MIKWISLLVLFLALLLILALARPSLRPLGLAVLTPSKSVSVTIKSQNVDNCKGQFKD
jgi:hypothetical protein